MCPDGRMFLLIMWAVVVGEKKRKFGAKRRVFRPLTPPKVYLAVKEY
jgi:hypothetical protein